MRITLDELKNVKTPKKHEAGRYTMRVIDAKEGVANSGTEYMQITVETMGEDVFKQNNRFYNTEKALGIFLNFLSSIGMYEEGKPINIEPEDIIGSIFSVELVEGKPNENGQTYLEFKPYTCEEVSGQATPKKTAKEVEESEQMPF